MDIQLSVIKLQHWKDIVENKQIVEKLENQILPNYMTKMRWFGGKRRDLKSVHIVDYAIIPFIGLDSAYVLLIEVLYHDGFPDIYQLPIAFSKIDVSFELQTNYLQSVISLIYINDQEGLLYDAIYGQQLQQTFINNMANNCIIEQKNGELVFTSTPDLKTYVLQQFSSTSKILMIEHTNTSIIYDEDFFLKIYRKVDRTINADVEINQFLNKDTNFRYIPRYIGTIEWHFGKETIVLGMMQEKSKSISDGWTYMVERMNEFCMNILLHTDITSINMELKGSLANPTAYGEISEDMKNLLNKTTLELISLLGHRTGQMHQALSSNNELSAFKPEEYSLHYQHSLFFSTQSLIETVFQNLQKTMEKLQDNVQKDVEEILDMKNEIITMLKRIDSRQINVNKIRIHGDYHLGQILFTGEDFIIVDFKGEPASSSNERRLKCCPLQDVAGMIRSFHYAAYGSLFLNTQIRSEDIKTLLPFIELWFHYISGFFIKSYLETVHDAQFIPNNNEDIEIFLETFLLRKAVYELNYELNYRPDWIIVPLRGIKSIIEKNRLAKIS